MMYLTLYLLFASAVFCQDLDTKEEHDLELEEELRQPKGDPHDYYNKVGKCDKVLERANTQFYTGDIAGVGNFNYYRSNDVKGGTTCGTFSINSGFDERLYTIFNTKFLHGKTQKSKLYSYSKGVVLEDVPDPRNPSKVFTFKLIFVHYDSKNGVLAYIRCADQGKRRKFIAYSVLIKASVWKDPDLSTYAKTAADTIVKNDGMDGNVNIVGTSSCP